MTHHITFPHLGLEFTVNTVAFSIGGFSVYWYGIIIAVGFLLALVYASYSCKKMNIDVNRLFDVVIVGLIAGVVFARLFYVVFYPGDKYRENPMEIFQIHDGGLAIYGGLIGAVFFGGLMAKIRKMKVAAVLDIASLGFLIGQGIGRWGNFINQEAFGSATDLPWGMHSDNTALVVDGNVHPCFLYESLLCLLGFVLLHFFTRKLRRYDGQTFLLYIVWYGACRFFHRGPAHRQPDYPRHRPAGVPGDCRGLRGGWRHPAGSVPPQDQLDRLRRPPCHGGRGPGGSRRAPAGGGAHRQHHLWGFARGRGAGNLL